MTLTCPALLGEAWKLTSEMDSGDWESEDPFWNALRFCQSLRQLYLSEFFRPDAFMAILIANPNLRDLLISYMDGFAFLDAAPDLDSLEMLQFVDCVDVGTDSLCNLALRAPRLLFLNLTVFFMPDGDLTPLRELPLLQQFHYASTGLAPGSLSKITRGTDSSRIWPSLSRVYLKQVDDEDADFALYFAPQLRELRLSVSFGSATISQLLPKLTEVHYLDFDKLDYLTDDHLAELGTIARNSLSRVILTSCIRLSSPKCNEFLRSLTSLQELVIAGSPDVVLDGEFGQQTGPAVGHRHNVM